MCEAVLYQWDQLGIEGPVNLKGNVTILKEANSPIIFLFDEEHDNSQCIDDNLYNAEELIAHANVQIIGVESKSGGKQWNETERIYYDEVQFDTLDDNILTSEYAQFADALLINRNVEVLGVECKGMLNKIENDLHMDTQYHNNPVNHPLNIERSKHFIKTLLELRTQNGKCGNAILNCGRDHNTHISQWINDGSIQEMIQVDATFIRISCIK